MTRKVIQIAATEKRTIALCDDGAMFVLCAERMRGDGRPVTYEWNAVPDIPQPNKKEGLQRY